MKKKKKEIRRKNKNKKIIRSRIVYASIRIYCTQIYINIKHNSKSSQNSDKTTSSESAREREGETIFIYNTNQRL